MRIYLLCLLVYACVGVGGWVCERERDKHETVYIHIFIHVNIYTLSKCSTGHIYTLT